MMKTKLGILPVLCQDCNTVPAVMFIKNYDGLTCDGCGKKTPRVTYGDLKERRKTNAQ